MLSRQGWGWVGGRCCVQGGAEGEGGVVQGAGRCCVQGKGGVVSRGEGGVVPGGREVLCRGGG